MRMDGGRKAASADNITAKHMYTCFTIMHTPFLNVTSPSLAVYSSSLPTAAMSNCELYVIARCHLYRQLRRWLSVCGCFLASAQ